ncbi:MAG: FAD-dependent oxidoreductase, partial [Xanthomonadales bacterium]|nr:FAD-dependent oxidoreductase [Xanthomonadales bacterium]
MSSQAQTFDHAVIGAGPAGITAVANLLDRGVSSIAWVDPDFCVGRLGARYRTVPDNTRAQLFQDYFQALPSVRGLLDHPAVAPAWQRLAELGPGDRGPLGVVCDVLQGLTEALRERTDARAARVTALEHRDDGWRVSLDDGSEVQARCVVLATGAVPAELPLPGLEGPRPLPLDVALDPECLRDQDLGGARAAVIGNSHSAVLVLKNLVELPAPPVEVLHVFRRPLIYAEYLDGWIRHDDTGLKGAAADWAREHLERVPHPLIRPLHLRPGDEPSLSQALEGCGHIVQAVGFTPAPLPVIRFGQREFDGAAIGYDDRCGQLLAPDGRELPGLFGLGIAFPQGEHDREGRFERRVGLWKFMRYAREVGAPLWMDFSRR